MTMRAFKPHRKCLRAAAFGVAVLALSAGTGRAQTVDSSLGPLRTETFAIDQSAAPVPARRSTTPADVEEASTNRAVGRYPEDDAPLRATRENERAAPIEGRARRAEAGPYEPLGLRLGTFVATARLDQGLGWTSNANASPTKQSSLFSESRLRLDAVSDWSRHEARLSLNGLYRRSLSGERIAEAEGAIDGELRLDLANEIDGLLALGYRVRPESPTSPSAIAGVRSRPLRHTFTGRGELSRSLGLLNAKLRGELVRQIFEDATLTDGTVVSQADRDSTLATAALRLGYEISPALRPFIEVEAGRRIFDEKRDSAGYGRSADRYALRAGLEIDLREKWSGEFSAGWLTERPDDDRLEAISGFAAGGRLAWSPVRGTVVELSGSTEVEGTTAAGESGALLYTSSLSVSRDLLSNLTARALIGVDLRNYSGSRARDLVFRGEASLTWWLNRFAGVTGRVEHEVQRSNLPGRDYEASSVYLGMTLQR